MAFRGGGINDNKFSSEIFIERADLIRLSNDFLSKKIIKINLENIKNNLESMDNLSLKDGDELRIMV